MRPLCGVEVDADHADGQPAGPFGLSSVIGIDAMLYVKGHL